MFITRIHPLNGKIHKPGPCLGWNRILKMHKGNDNGHLRDRLAFLVAVLALVVVGLFGSAPASAETTTTIHAKPVAQVVSEGPSVVALARPVITLKPKQNLTFTAVAKPKPKPRVKPIATPAVSNRVTATTNVNNRSTISYAPAPSAGRAAQVLAIAASLAGIYYIYGGTTTAGFDCSGFTQYVYRKVGVSLPRVAEDQRRFARPVSSPRPGDLVFFGIPAGHVGIYAGNHKMWDSPRTGKAIALREIWSSNVTYGRVL